MKDVLVRLREPTTLTNLPCSLIELKLKGCRIKLDKIKLPYGCKLIIE